MGARGPLKIPPHIALVKSGAASADATSVASTVPRLAPAMPASVRDNRELAALWDEIVPELDRTGLLAPSDGPAVELALRHYLMARRASDEVSSVAVETDADHGGMKKHPAEAVFRLESAMFLQYATQLGMTFVSRARTPAAKGADDGDANPFAVSGG